MRTLNRPMFRYGGPIKEGIMDGMKDNKQAINTVGSPLAPKDETGRGGYAIPLLAGVGMAAARVAPYAARGLAALRNIYSRQVPAQFSRVRSRIVPKSGEYSPISTPTYGREFVKGGTGPVQGVGMTRELRPFVQRDPILRTLFGAGKYGSMLGKPVKSLAKYSFTTPTGLALTGYGAGSYLYDKFTGGEQPSVGGATELPGGTARDRGMGIEGKTGMTGTQTPKSTAVDQDALDKLNKDRIQATKDKYYKLMGIDKMNKEAVYDSLIDASKIISEEGADLKGALKSGTLQNRIIGAISGQLDKSKALKRQIDAAVLKGEIEKDISGAKPGSYLKQAQDYAAMKNISVDQAYKELGFNKEGDLMEDIRAYNTKQGTLPSGNQLAGLARGRNINITSVADTTEVKNWMNENKGKNEIDFLEAVVATGAAEDGAYVVNDRILVIQDGKVKPYL
jgi:hypothetical protein